MYMLVYVVFDVNMGDGFNGLPTFWSNIFFYKVK